MATRKRSSSRAPRKGGSTWYGLLAGLCIGLLVAAGIAARHVVWIRRRERAACFRAFLDNTWFGFAVFAGIFVQTTALPYFS